MVKNKKQVEACFKILLKNNSKIALRNSNFEIVQTERLELSWVAPQAPKACAYTSSATSA
jgi:hypothetical protein